MEPMRTACASVLLALAIPLLGQSHPPAHPRSAPPSAPFDDASANAAPEVPTRVLKFAAEDPIPGLPPSNVVSIPYQCTSDGTLFLDIALPPDSTKRALYAISAKKSTPFPISAITNLHAVSVIGYFPSEKIVGLLIRASTDPDAPVYNPFQRPSTAAPQTSSKKVDWSSFHYYIARFNRSGAYKDSVELPLHNFIPSKLAVLGSGQFLVLGFDRADNLPRLLHMSDTGEILRSLPMPRDMESYDAPSDSTSPEASMASGKLIGSINFTSYGESIPIWRRDAHAPVVVVGPGGSAREIPLEAPKGFVLADIVPSNTKWIVHYQPAAHQQGAAVNQSDTVYYDVSPADGSLLSRLRLTGDTPAENPHNISCENDGDFISYRTDDKGKLNRLVAR